MGAWEKILKELAENDFRHGGFIKSALDEIESLRQQLEDAKQEAINQALDADDLRQELKAERAKVKRLLKYIRHERNCVAITESGCPPCDCGLDALLTELGEG